jgi:hypothetical protein
MLKSIAICLLVVAATYSYATFTTVVAGAVPVSITPTSVTASSSHSTSLASRVIAGGCWNSGRYAPGWLELDLGNQPVLLSSIVLLPALTPREGFARVIASACDGSSKCDRVGEFEGRITSKVEFSLPVGNHSTRARSLRLEFEQWGTSWVSICGFQLLGQEEFTEISTAAPLISEASVLPIALLVLFCLSLFARSSHIFAWWVPNPPIMIGPSADAHFTQSTHETVCNPELKPPIKLPADYIVPEGDALIAALIAMRDAFSDVPALQSIVHESAEISTDRRLRLAAKGTAILTPDQALVIALYTYDLGMASVTENGSDNFFFACNAVLRNRESARFKALRPFIALFKSAVAALPVQIGVVYRGVPATAADEIATHYVRGMTVYWSGITSVTADFNVARRFAGDGGVVFRVHMVDGRDLRPYSCYPPEHECVLLPNAKLVVANHCRVDGGIKLYELQQTVTSEYRF